MADINQLGLSSDPSSFTELGGNVYFVADDGISGRELYRTNATTGATTQVTDLFPGPGSSGVQYLTAVNGELFFVASNDGGEGDLWKTNGTAAGTVKLLDSTTNNMSQLSQLTASGTKLFFTAYDDVTGNELWVSNGTAAGTVLVRDINSNQTVNLGPADLTDVNGTLFFSSYSQNYDNRELWKSDGTLAGTVLVKDIDGNAISSSSPQDLTASGSSLYFTADEGDGFEVFRSDGTAAGTIQVADLNPGADSSYPSKFTAFGGNTYFVADPGTGPRLYSTNGTTVTPLPNLPNGAIAGSPDELTVVDGKLYFVADGGTLPGPRSAVAPLLVNGNSGRNNSNQRVAGVVDVKTSPYTGALISGSGSHTYDFVTMGTTNDGPGFVSNARIGAAGVGLSSIEVGDLIISGDNFLTNRTWDWTLEDPAGLTSINFSGFASGNEFDEANERLVFELFLNNSATATTTINVTGDLLDNYFGSRTSGNIALNNAGGATVTKAVVRMRYGTTTPNNIPDGTDENVIVRATLTAQGGSGQAVGRELHAYDGTSMTRVADIVAGASSNPADLTTVGTTLYFTADNPINGTGRELYKSNGTQAGTVLVTDIRPGNDTGGLPLSSLPSNLTAAGGKVFFSATGTNGDTELWSSDGSVGGTTQTLNINSTTQSSNPEQLVQSGNLVYFVANDGVNGKALYVADPAAGTVNLAVDVSASAVDDIYGLTRTPTGDLYFAHTVLGVFKYSGTTLTNLTSQIASMDPISGKVFEFLGNTAYFAATTPLVLGVAQGIELWKTDGTVAGTVVHADVNVDAIGSNPSSLTEHNGAIYFAGFTNSLGRELYRTTATGVENVVDLQVNSPVTVPTGNSNPRSLVSIGANLFFVAQTSTNGTELYATTGLGATQLTLISGSSSAFPESLTEVNGLLYYSGFASPTQGRELYRSDGTVAGTTLVANIAPTTASSDPDGFVVVGSNTYFAASTATSGRELYRTDGTSVGTVQVANLQPGAASSSPIVLGALPDGRVLLSAIGNNLNGRELHITGSPITGILPVADVNPGIASSDPTNLMRVNGVTVFVATDATKGRELRLLTEITPKVTSTTINNPSTAQRSSIKTVDVNFDSIVQVQSGAFVLRNTTSTTPLSINVAMLEVAGKTVARLTFNQGTFVNANGLLLNGNYTLTVDQSKVSSFGTPLDGNGDGTPGDNYVFGGSPTDNFFRKFGDFNGDNLVSLPDFAAFRGQFGRLSSAPNWDIAFDSDGNGAIDLIDFAAFRGAFGT